MSDNHLINEEAEALKEAGNKLVGKQQYLAALKKYQKAASIDPTRAAYYSNMALCYDKMKELVNFEEASRKCIQCDPTFVRGYQRLASALEQLWKFDEGMETAKKGLAIDPNNHALLKIKASLDFKINRRKQHQKDVLKADRSNFPFFGGLRPGAQCKIPGDSAYGRLERSPLPPQSMKQLSKLQSGRYGKEIEPLVRAFFAGDLRVEWQLQETTSLGEQNRRHVFSLNAYMPDDPEDSGPVLEVIMVIADLGIDENGETCHGIGLTKETKQNPKYHNVVPQYLWDSLRLVLLQRFLREKAALLNKDHIDIPLLGSIIQDLSSRLQDEGLYYDVADVKLIMIDVCLNCGTNAGIIYNAVALGEAMEAAGNYEDAAKVYIEISEAKIFPRISRICPEIRSRNFAGLAFKRAQDYVRAEEQYVAALRAADPNWSFRDGEIENLLNNTMTFYEVAHMAVMSGQRIDNEHKQIQQACLLLVGLLSIAGWVGNGGCTLMHAQNPQGYKVLQGNLKREYKTPRKAMRALQNVFSAPNIEEYHKRLFACSKYASIITIADNETKSSIEETLAKEPAKSKNGAQAEFKKHQLGPSNTLLSSLCNGCNERKSTEQMKACPCQTVFYCSVECQKVHWPIHKRICPYWKRNKK